MSDSQFPVLGPYALRSLYLTRLLERRRLPLQLFTILFISEVFKNQNGNSSMLLIIDLLKGLIEGLIWGIVFLFLAVFLLPDQLFAKILKRIKPDFISKTLVMNRVKLILDYLLNWKDIVVEDLNLSRTKSQERNIAGLLQEKRVLEGNLFFLDLLKGLSAVMNFSAIHAGYGDRGFRDMLAQSMSYLQFYAKEIHRSNIRDNQGQRIVHAATELEEEIIDVSKFLSTAEGKDQLEMAHASLKSSIQRFDSYMREEYDTVKVQLSRLNQLLADRIMEYIG